MWATMSVESEFHEMLLVFPQAYFSAVDRRLDHSRRRVGFFPPMVDVLYQFTARKAVEVLHDKVREADSKRG